MAEEIDDEEFPCPECQKIYATAASLKRHITMKHTPPPDPIAEIIEPEPTPPPKKKKKKHKAPIPQTKDKREIVKSNHQLWRRHPELAPLGWEDNTRGEK